MISCVLNKDVIRSRRFGKCNSFLDELHVSSPCVVGSFSSSLMNSFKQVMFCKHIVWLMFLFQDNMLCIFNHFNG
ncbi:hypothetical protein HanRHA438_Chr05g0224661 [Helianthus annuus]|nr:hypothetical protein HanRHA438_Chr05g0224661 [Helianthus annuus]